MRICLVTPAPARAYTGNGVTAGRWAEILTGLGHDVTVLGAWDGTPCDVLIALHARRSADSVTRFRRSFPHVPVVLALTGTDLYRDLERSAEARRSVRLATRYVVLQPRGRDVLGRELRHRTHVIPQSLADPPRGLAPRQDVFEVVVLAHLRPVKDPLRAAAAARRLPPESRIQVVHLGGELTDGLADTARTETAQNPRYTWLGEVDRKQALRRLAASRLLVLTSRLEGGANVVSEAIACHVPVVSSRIDGSVGMLGADYPGYFPVGDEAALADLLWRVERDADGVYEDMIRRVAALSPTYEPATERAAWAGLLDGLGG